jgi:CelD/BcsL family acetyltransferase involved in cellulose biosynthesis
MIQRGVASVVDASYEPVAEEEATSPPLNKEAMSDVRFQAEQAMAGLERIESEWTALAGSIPDAQFNHFPGWYRAYLTSGRCDPASVWFIVARNDSQALVGVFPLQFQSRRVKLLRPRLLGTIDDDELQLSDFTFAKTAGGASLVYQLTHWLRRQRTLRWDQLRLVKITENSSLAHAMRAQPPDMTLAEVYDRSAYFDTTGTYEQATQWISAKFRSNLRRRARLAQASEKLRFESCRCSAGLEAAFNTFLEVEASGWKGDAGTVSAIRCRPDMLGFYSGLVREFGPRGECVIHLLWLGEQAIAAQLGLRIGRTLHMLKVGYRDELSVFAPGILLQEMTIRHACEDPGLDVLNMVNDPAWLKSFRPFTIATSLYRAPNLTVRGLITHLSLLARLKWKSPAEKQVLSQR